MKTKRSFQISSLKSFTIDTMELTIAIKSTTQFFSTRPDQLRAVIRHQIFIVIISFIVYSIYAHLPKAVLKRGSIKDLEPPKNSGKFHFPFTT